MTTVLIVILLAAFGIRLYESLTPDEYVSQDEAAYTSLAETIYLHGSYGGPPAKTSSPERWTPGAPVLFAAAFAARGEISPTAARISQALVGTLLVFVVYLLATNLSRRRSAGLIAAALIAVYPPIVKITGDLLSEPLGALLLATGMLFFLLATDYGRSSNLMKANLWYSLSGLALGLAVLTRADYLLLPLVLFPFAIASVSSTSRTARRPWLSRLLPAFALLLAFSLTLAPWSIRNSILEDRFVPVTTGGATPLFIGTYLPGDGGRAGVKEELRDEAERIHPSIKGEPTFRIPAQFIMDSVARRHPDLSRDRAISLEARKNIRRYALNHPIDFTAMMFKKIPRMWDRPYDGGRYPASSGPRLLHIGYLVFGVIGAFLLLARGARRFSALVVTTVIVYGTALHLLVVAFPRYNLPLMPLVIALGAAGVVPALDKMYKNLQVKHSSTLGQP